MEDGTINMGQSQGFAEALGEGLAWTVGGDQDFQVRVQGRAGGVRMLRGWRGGCWWHM
jgi:hypothetical protein